MPGLYRPEFESDSCGFGLLAQMDGEPSHQLVRSAIGALSRLTHRGAVDADGKSGDGCGLLLKLPEGFLRELAGERGLHLGERFGVGMVFLHPDPEPAEAARLLLAEELERAGLRPVGWRPVPVDPQACGPQALKGLPRIEQLFVNAPDGVGPAEFERRLYLARRRCRKAIHHQDQYFYVASLSCRVIAYKGLVLPRNLPLFYRDLQDPRLATALAVFHQRFSTNTWPEWRLAQPFRYLAHNGELNSIQGNRNWALARSYKFKSPHVRDMEDIRPWVSMTGSDSCSLDNMLEALVMGGMDLFRAMRLLIPPAWQNQPGIDPDLRAFYEYHSMHMEPWDGPAGIVLTDGRYGACVMDRNGLRPARYWITKDRRILLGSEVGLCPVEPGQIVRKGRLRPGEMLAVDTDKGALLLPADIDARLARRRPYKAWLQAHARRLDACLDEPEGLDHVRLPNLELARYQKTFGLSLEELEQVLRALGENAKEPLGSMGDDTPLAVLSSQPRSLFDYFRQQFAQVTNPPIDSLRESIVMSLETCLGREQNLFFEDTEHAARLVLATPVLSAGKFNRIRLQNDPRYAYARLNLNYPRGQELVEALAALCSQATAAVRGGRTLLLLSDREIGPERLPMHALLAVGAVHQRLIREGLRCDANLLLETGCAINPHQFAALIGYGATAVYPYLAYACLARFGLDALAKYRQGINQGLRKILSKMGISSIASYRGAQLFEAVGLHPEVIDLCFTGTPSRIGGAGFAELEAEQAELSRQAWRVQAPLSPGGLLKYVHGGEYHAFNPEVVHALHQAVAGDDPERYRRYARLVNQRPPTALRDLLRLRSAARPLPLDRVEPVEAILPRFETGAMSLGALSPEAHETLALAMNGLGGRSNSGEGGEDAARYRSERVSKIKQVASGRFGVTPEYLVNAEVLQIKIAQGAKPGEGGQLAGAKVNELIARLRYTRPGTPLISPPPHHDIYSIEDLAQLIFDLKQVNPDAWVSVKLVAEPGVGTIAAGVAKAYADQITISGHDGGTGASPLSSVRYAGSPWELGLAETQQTLRRNGLRGRVRLQTDGGLKTGLDVVKAALLGAESYGFGTAALVAMGCKYLRICHLNNCATGVATQHEVLRGHFRGEAERVMGFFRALAEEVREHLAQLGVRSLGELIGRSELLEIHLGEGPKQARLNLGPLLDAGGAPDDAPRSCRQARNPSFDHGELAERMLADCRQAIEQGQRGEFRYEIGNHNRSIGARLAGEIARRYGNQGLEASPIRIRLQGSAGQSLGAWNTGGLHLYLEGDANDYVGKGMAGGRIVLYPPPDSPFEGRDNVIVGNTCLYGATGGRLYAAGQAGERFAVRNSGAIAVVEGVGDHGCEYMTGGLVVVLGPAGCNFGAGMTGGAAMVLDQAGDFADRYNHELVDIQRITTEATEPHREALRRLLRHYAAATGSPWGRELVQDFERYAARFWLVKPRVAELGELLAGLREAA